jgi:hypothetical protein
MKSAHRNFAFAIRLIWVVLLLMLVAPHAPAQQEEKAPADQQSAQKAPDDQRTSGKQQVRPPRGNNDTKARAGSSRGSSENAPKRSGPSNRSGNGNDGGSSKPARGWGGPAAHAPARSASSTETAQDSPDAPEDKPAPRGNGNNRPGRSGSSSESGTAAPRPSRNAQAGRGTSANTPAQPASAANAGDQAAPGTEKPVRNSPLNGRPAQGGSSTGNSTNKPDTNKPGRSNAPADASDNSKPPRNMRPGRGSSTKPAVEPGNTANAGGQSISGNRKSNGNKNAFTRTTRANGTVVDHDKSGKTRGVTTARGTTAKLDNRGRVTTIRDKGGNTINRGPRGERRVETVRADRSRVVSIGRRGGYVERPLDRGGRQYLQRTYVIGGVSYVHVYRGYHYHGRPYFVYVPPYYYAPAYYGWVFNPWPRPIYYSWGWYGSPWYRPYGYYFAPYPVYPYASLWLTDYLIAENLRLAYEADAYSFQPDGDSTGVVLAAYRPAAPAKSDQPVVLTPAVKQMIADEVKAVIADQQKSATSASGGSSGDEIPPALDPNHRVFVAFSVVEADEDGDTCSLTSSDVIKRIEDVPDDDNSVAVQVLASKNADCAIGSTVRVELAELIDMENHLREQVDAGLKILSEKQGKDGLPPAPAANPRATAEGMATPDPTAAAELHKQEQAADQTEKEVEQEAASDSGSAK